MSNKIIKTILGVTLSVIVTLSSVTGATAVKAENADAINYFELVNSIDDNSVSGNTISGNTADQKLKKEIKAAKKAYLKTIKIDKPKKFAVIDLTGDDVPELLLMYKDSISIYRYDAKNDCSDYIYASYADKVKYDKKSRTLVISSKTERPIEGEGGDDKWEHTKKQVVTEYCKVKFTKSGTVSKETIHSKWYITYTSKYKPDTYYYDSKKKFEAAKKWGKGFKTVKFVNNTASARSKLK